MATEEREPIPYWEARAISQEQRVNDSLSVLERKVFNAYEKAQRYLTAEASKIYDRYLSRSGRTEDEVRQILNTTVPVEELVELQRLAQTIEDPVIKRQVQTYLNGLSAKFRITRLEDLKAKSYIVAKQIADVQQIEQTDFYIDVIQEAYDQAGAEAIIGRTEAEILPREPYTYQDNVIEIVDWRTGEVAREIKLEPGAPVKFKELSTPEVQNILTSEWKGANYSERIWNDTGALAKKLEELFTVEAMTGMSELEMAHEIQNEFRVGSNIAKRLIRTEANYMANQAKLKGWINHGVERYVIVAVLDLRTSNICQKQDGTIYDVAKALVSINYPPFHPWCRTTVRAYFGKHTLSGTRTANDPITGDTFVINMSDTYRDWEAELQERHGKKEVELNRLQLINFNRDKEQFERYRAVIGDDMPSTLEEFQRIKYNDPTRWEELKRKYRLNN